MWRRKPAEPTLRIFFATDIHGSEQCFRKWLSARKAYRADVLILGGDITGKALVPFVQEGDGRWMTEGRGGRETLVGEEALRAATDTTRRMGYYAMVISAEEKENLESDPQLLEARFRQVMRQTLEDWMSLADERLPEGFPAYAMLGNDDHPDLVDVLRASSRVTYAEDDICELPNGAELLSVGFSNRTPWNSPREVDDDVLGGRIRQLVDRLKRPENAVLNLHCPPYGSHLDLAPVLDDELKPRAGMAGGVEVGPVGSKAVRRAVEETQAALALHGHVHECSAGERLGCTLCINPGSDYLAGSLRGAIVELTESGQVHAWQMTQG